MARVLTRACLGIAALFCSLAAQAGREPVLRQIDVPHHYYFREMYLPQLTSAPGSLAWSPDGGSLVYSMAGRLWQQRLGETTAQQLTSGPGYDYQPDVAPDGRIVFTRYHADALELHLLDPDSGETHALTSDGSVNLDPRWSPDGRKLAWVSTRDSGRFHVFIGTVTSEGGRPVLERSALLPERRSSAERYYYSPWDHQLSPSWSPDGREIIYVGNPEVSHGTGDIWRRRIDGGGEPILIRREETNWRARPDWSPDGKRVAWSSYLGRQWHQLWITTAAGGGNPYPLTYGDYDVTSVRWSPDGSRVAYVSNEDYNLAIWVQQVIGGARQRVEIRQREPLGATGMLRLQVLDEAGRPVAARVSVTGSDQRFHAPVDVRIHGDDGFDRQLLDEEVHYFHVFGRPVEIMLPAGSARVTVWRGLEHGIERATASVAAGGTRQLDMRVRPLDLPQDWDRQSSSDSHVHMNYGGHYRNEPGHLVSQAAAEDLDVVFNLIVNKEQRIPDIEYFSPQPDAASTDDVLLLHAQEFHTSYWGHLGLLNLERNYLLSDYSGYPNTASASLYPDNATVADLAHAQGALVGYVHPFDIVPDPAAPEPLTQALAVDVALGKVDFLEVVGFSNHRETASVWYRLLNCGFRPVAAAGTDAMANYASLRGPVGLARVYVDLGDGFDRAAAGPEAWRDRWLKAFQAGRTMATNGPLLGFTLGDKGPGEEIRLPPDGGTLDYAGFLRSIVGIDHLELVVNGAVMRVFKLDQEGMSADIAGELELNDSAWVLLRAWNDEASPDIFDLYPYATTNPVHVVVEGEELGSSKDAQYLLAWADRVRESAAAHPAYLTANERDAVLGHIDAARERLRQCH